jgi:OOP family OmpA-OmpF porin
VVAALSVRPAHAADGPAATEAAEYWFEMSVAAGGHAFTKNHGLGRDTGDPPEQSPANSGVLGARLGVHFSQYATLEVEGLGSSTHTRNDAANMWVFQYAAQVAIYPFGRTTVQPFLLLGYGALASVVNDPSVIPDDQDGMARAGLGVKVNLGQRWGLRLEGRVLSPLAFAAKVAPVGDETGYGGPDFQGLASLTFDFGRVEKRIVFKEKVVLKDVSDADPDHDGIAGDADKCPKVAEDVDGFEDDDGCPDHDNDNDGIPDAQDKCPNKPENKNGIEDDDGCPEEDPDGDGFLGDADKCPNEPETKNGYQDKDGCPDELPPEVRRFSGVIPGINFRNRSAILVPSSFAILDRAFAMLKEHPEISVEIAGHTDSRGRAAFNRDLSRRRAESVRSYLVKKGISPARLTAVGYGKDSPLATNKTARGRATNRRTEFRIIWEAE